MFYGKLNLVLAMYYIENLRSVSRWTQLSSISGRMQYAIPGKQIDLGIGDHAGRKLGV